MVAQELLVLYLSGGTTIALSAVVLLEGCTLAPILGQPCRGGWGRVVPGLGWLGG